MILPFRIKKIANSAHVVKTLRADDLRPFIQLMRRMSTVCVKILLFVIIQHYCGQSCKVSQLRN